MLFRKPTLWTVLCATALLLLSGCGSKKTPKQISLLNDPALFAAGSTSTLRVGPPPIRAGDAGAPLRMVLFGSYTSSYSHTFFSKQMPTLIAAVKRGSGTLIFKPLERNTVDRKIAEISECLPDRTQRFSFVSAVMAAAPSEKGSQALPTVRAIARRYGADSARLSVCSSNALLAEWLEIEQHENANLYGIQSAPTLVVNGRTLVNPDRDEITEALRGL
ncbi:MAG: thioredoxin domain-containing protein [Magnetococcales bacterium]|nr:thioredoxin domain-containing protein [Magnetococcales bacterium]